MEETADDVPHATEVSAVLGRVLKVMKDRPADALVAAFVEAEPDPIRRATAMAALASAIAKRAGSLGISSRYPVDYLRAWAGQRARSFADLRFVCRCATLAPWTRP